MKTPRELLLQRHRSVEPKLDRLREEIVAGLSGKEQRTADRKFLFFSLLRNAWRELIWPSRRIWSGLAAAWLVLLAVNLQMNRSHAVSNVPVRSVAAAVNEQRRILIELVQRPMPEPALPHTPEALRPRSDRRALVRTC